MIRLVLAVWTALMIALPLRAEVKIQEFTSPGGIKVWLVEEHSIPFTALEIRFMGGASLDAPGKRGAINLMTGLLEEGAADLDAQGFAQAQEELASHYSFDVHDDALAISAKFLTENRDQAVALLRKALLEPRFDPDAIERVRAQVVASILSDAKDPNAIASARFNKLAYDGHPYGSDQDGTLDSVAALTRDDLLEAKARVMVRDRLYVSAVGDITADELGALLDHLLGDLPASGAPDPEMAPYLLTGGVTVVPFDTPQSVVIFGHDSLEREDPDFFAAFVMNQILGGGNFSSRLMREVREKRGLTYGVYTYLADKDYADLLVGQVASANDRVGEAISVIHDEWARMAQEGVTQKELDEAKTYLTGAYPLRFDGNGPIANIMVGMQMTGLPVDYINTRNAQIEAVTLEDVARVAKRIVKPDALRFVVVGQPEGVTETQ